MDAGFFFDEFRPFRRGELALCRRLEKDPLFLGPRDADTLRYALRLAQLSTIGKERDDLLHPIGSLRLRLLQLLAPVLPTDPDQIDAADLHELLPRVVRLVEQARELILERGLCSEAALDAEIARKRLVLVLGGAAGSGYIYLGALERLEELGVAPDYLIGCSIGAILGVIRARRPRFDSEEVYEELRRVRADGVLRAPDLSSRYTLPAALRLDLRRALGRLFAHPDGELLRLSELALPIDIMTTGMGPGALTGTGDEFADLVHVEGVDGLAHLRAGAVARLVARLVSLAMSRRVLLSLPFGTEREADAIAALDAAGFSACIPGLLSYDVAAEDGRARRYLEQLFTQHGLLGLVDGGITSVLPAHHAWEQVESGRIGSRHSCILALDAVTSAGGANRLVAPFLRAVTASAQRDKAYWDLHVAFRGTPPLLDLFPSESRLRRASERGEAEFEETARLLRGYLAPTPRWQELAGDSARMRA